MLLIFGYTINFVVRGTVRLNKIITYEIAYCN